MSEVFVKREDEGLVLTKGKYTFFVKPHEVNKDIVIVEYYDREIEVPIGSHRGKTVVLAADHRGFEYKEEIKRKLLYEGYARETIDVGTYSMNRCDYPQFSLSMGEEVSKSPLKHVGIGICGSGIGIGEMAAKFPYVYVARCKTKNDAELSRRHNNSNVLTLSADARIDDLWEIVTTWMSTPFYSDFEEIAEKPRYLLRYVEKVLYQDRIKNTWMMKY